MMLQSLVLSASLTVLILFGQRLTTTTVLAAETLSFSSSLSTAGFLWDDELPSTVSSSHGDLSKVPPLSETLLSLSSSTPPPTTFSSSRGKARVVVDELVDQRQEDDHRSRLGHPISGIDYDEENNGNPFSVHHPQKNNRMEKRQPPEEVDSIYLHRPNDDTSNCQSQSSLLKLHLKTTHKAHSNVFSNPLLSSLSAHSVDNDSAPFMSQSKNNNKLKKTGTTIAGCCVRQEDGSEYVILGADTRATESTMVADKRCEKVHKLASNLWCCGAGTSADLDHITRHCRYYMALQSLLFHEQEYLSAATMMEGKSNRGNETQNKRKFDDNDDYLLLSFGPVSIDSVCQFFQECLFDGGGSIGANLIVGGVWEGQGMLRAIHPHGSMDSKLPFAALGSGGLAAMGVLENGYHPKLTLQDGKKLVQNAILAGIRHDLGSGSQVDLCVIHPDGTSEYIRCVVPEEHLPPIPIQETSTLSTATTNNNEKDLSFGGVNGFGNLPFAMKSQRVRLSNLDQMERDRRTKLSKLLGIEL